MLAGAVATDDVAHQPAKHWPNLAKPAPEGPKDHGTNPCHADFLRFPWILSFASKLREEGVWDVQADLGHVFSQVARNCPELPGTARNQNDECFAFWHHCPELPGTGPELSGTARNRLEAFGGIVGARNEICTFLRNSLKFEDLHEISTTPGW